MAIMTFETVEYVITDCDTVLKSFEGNLPPREPTVEDAAGV